LGSNGVTGDILPAVA